MDHKWQIELVQGRYQAYNLSFEQAEKIYRFELDKDVPSDKDFFSQWEEWDFELLAFREILNEGQLALYLRNHEAAVKEYEQSLIKEDNSEQQLKQLAHTNRVIDYYQHEFVPGLLKNETLRRAGYIMHPEGNKLNYLKEEYKKYYASTRKQMQINFIRHNRTFKPNELKHLLLHYSLNNIWPNYQHFYSNADKPTQAAGDFLYERVSRYFKSEEAFIIKSGQENQRFLQALHKEYFGEMRGWHVTIDLSPDDELKWFSMSLLLLNAGV